MADKEEEKLSLTNIPVIDNIRIRHIGTLDLGEFYRWLQRWFDFQGYDVYETQYIEEIQPGGGKHYKITWECTKDKTKYFKYKLEIRWLLINITRVEIQKGTDKVRVERGDFELREDAIIEMGPRTGDFLANHKWARDIYEKFMIRQRIEEMKIDLYDKGYDLQEEIKNYFNQSTP